MNILESAVITATVMFIFAASGVSDVLLLRLYRFSQTLVANGNRDSFLLALAAHPAKLNMLETIGGILIFTAVGSALVFTTYYACSGLTRILLRTAR